MKQIRLMKREDVFKIVKIYKEYSESDSKIIKRVYVTYYSKKHNSKFLKDYVLILDGTIIGFSGFHKEQTETNDVFWLNWTAIKKEHSNQKYGRELIAHIVKEIKKLNGRKLYVSTSSSKNYLSARKFYQSVGFKKEAILKDYYSKKDNMIIFSTKL